MRERDVGVSLTERQGGTERRLTLVPTRRLQGENTLGRHIGGACRHVKTDQISS